ncbi:hypothetical protein [Pseudooceanicola marinus]|uniref:hypothetical protein n=1 Tax=Pseudooceanicola marinus TaxID=396013 RepID=UPI001CD6A2BA|nr:hypothetical protein [Pseudooceanicola marinus]MCA1336887.1 hypothetical protein [Pseudooceanicola marinus]
MPDRMIVKEESIRTPDGRKAIYFEIYDVVTVEGREYYHKRSDVGFKTREEAEAFIARQGKKLRHA